jgi:hypothetical protein
LYDFSIAKLNINNKLKNAIFNSIKTALGGLADNNLTKVLPSYCQSLEQTAIIS